MSCTEICIKMKLHMEKKEEKNRIYKWCFISEKSFLKDGIMIVFKYTNQSNRIDKCKYFFEYFFNKYISISVAKIYFIWKFALYLHYIYIIYILYLWISFSSSYEMTNYSLIMRVIHHCIIVMLFYLMS